jgi:hypothetical protein
VVRLVGALQPRVADQRVGRFDDSIASLSSVLGAALELVSAAPRHEVDPEAAGLVFKSLPPVFTATSSNASKSSTGRGAARGGVGDDDAVEFHIVSVAMRPCRQRPMLTRLVAADIDAVDDHAWHRLEHAHGSFDGGVLCSPGRPGRQRPHLLDVDDRGLAVTVTVSSTDFTAIGNASVAFTPCDDDVALHLVEAAEAGRDLVGPGIQVEEPELPLAVSTVVPVAAADRHPPERDVDARSTPPF